MTVSLPYLSPGLMTCFMIRTVIVKNRFLWSRAGWGDKATLHNMGLRMADRRYIIPVLGLGLRADQSFARPRRVLRRSLCTTQIVGSTLASQEQA
jgi:hypothetical protein